MSDEALRQAAASIESSAESFRQTAGILEETATRFLVRLEDILEHDRKMRREFP